jgi:hypothetical protein
VEEIQRGHGCATPFTESRQAADRLILGSGYPDTGLVLVDQLGKPIGPELHSDRFRKLSRAAGLRPIYLHLVRHTLAGLWIDLAWHQWTPLP